MIEKTVALPDGARLACQVAGADDALPLLLLAGQANSHHWWDGVRADLTEHFHTISFDYRGTGSTVADDSWQAGWSTRSFAADAAAVIEGLGYDRVHVYGTSMGGRVAQMLAVDHPERVGRLVLACTTPGGPGAFARGKEIRDLLGSPDPAVRRAALMDLMYTPAWVAAPRRPSTILGDPTMSARAARMHLRASDGHDASGLLASISAKTLVLHGADDLMVPTANAPLLAAAIPGAELVIVEDARHGFFDEFPAVTDRVVDFLRAE